MTATACKQRSRKVLIDLAGKRPGRLEVLFYVGGNRWVCVCECGARVVVLGASLRKGRTKSCGCLARERATKHGMSRSRAYGIWKAMMQRCYNPNCSAYAYYGGRGIIVCECWHSFVNFLIDMGEPPPGLSIDRINNDGNYEPTNCRWATPSEQNQNRRPPKLRVKRGDLKIFTDIKQLSESRSADRRNSMSNSPIFVATFADGEIARMSVWQGNRKTRDLVRAVRLARAAYVSRMNQEPPTITEGQFVSIDGDVLASYDDAQIARAT